jgi:hypothetical protein
MTPRFASLRWGWPALLLLTLFCLAPESRAQPDAAAAPAPSELSPNVTITITLVPSRMATVSWGKQRLGIIKPRGALVVKRPRDSGPLDLMIRATGCLPVQTRAYTFNDTKLAVRVTPLDQKATLLGYREDLDAGPDGEAPLGVATDAGAGWADF